MHIKCRFNAFTITFKRTCSTFHWKSYNPNSLYQWNTKITSCFKCGDIENALKLFDKIPHKNLVTWNCMISGYVRNGMILDARKMFDEMPQRNVVSWTAMLTGYAKCGNLEEARSLFDAISCKNVVCWNSMISGYVASGRIREGRELFDVMLVKNEVTWATIIEGYFGQGLVSEAEMLFEQAPVKSVSICNAMLCGYAGNGDVDAVFKLFMRMPERDVASWTSVISCFLSVGELEKARALFDEMAKKDVVMWTVMIRGFLDWNKVEEARRLFDEMPRQDAVAWNTMIGGYVQNGMMVDALELFFKMPQRDIVSWNSVLQGYVQGNDMVQAHKFFEEIPQKDKTSWNTIISGYQCEEALVLYVKMLQSGLVPDQGTFTSVISACGALAVHDLGRTMHTCVVKIGYENDTLVISSVISMYSKCGFMRDASLVFERMRNMDTVAWNAIIAAHAYHGCAVRSVELFQNMIKAGFLPDHVTFLGLLAACAHSGMVDRGWIYFMSMERDWKLIPKAEHYGCMVDLLGRSGLLAEAYELVQQLPVNLPAYTWETLLSYCGVHNNFEIGERVMEKLSATKALGAGMNVLFSNIYVARGMWNDAANIRTSVERHGLRKELASSWIELRGQVYRFVCTDKSHPQMENIKKELESLTIIMEEFGPIMHL